MTSLLYGMLVFTTHEDELIRCTDLLGPTLALKTHFAYNGIGVWTVRTTTPFPFQLQAPRYPRMGMIIIRYFVSGIAWPGAISPAELLSLNFIDNVSVSAIAFRKSLT